MITCKNDGERFASVDGANSHALKYGHELAQKQVKLTGITKIRRIQEKTVINIPTGWTVFFNEIDFAGGDDSPIAWITYTEVFIGVWFDVANETVIIGYNQ